MDFQKLFQKCMWSKKEEPFFPSLWGYWGELTIYIEIFLRFLVYLHKLSIRKNFINKIFFKKFKKKFRFFFSSKGPPLWISQKSKKNFKFFEKKFINKIFSYAQFMKVHQKSQCIWSGLPNNPRGWEKRAPFFKR